MLMISVTCIMSQQKTVLKRLNKILDHGLHAVNLLLLNPRLYGCICQGNIITTSRKHHHHSVDLHLNRKRIIRVKEVCYLEVLITTDLTWSAHIHSVI